MDELQARIDEFVRRPARGDVTLERIAHRARWRRLRRRGAIGIGGVALLFAAGLAVNAAGSDSQGIKTVDSPPVTVETSTTAPRTAVAPAPTGSAASFEPDELPSEGIAVQRSGEQTVRLYALDGTELGEVDGSELEPYYHGLVRGPVGIVSDTPLRSDQLVTVGPLPVVKQSYVDYGITRMPLADGATLVVDHGPAGTEARVERADGSSSAIPGSDLRVSADRRAVAAYAVEGWWNLQAAGIDLGEAHGAGPYVDGADFAVQLRALDESQDSRKPQHIIQGRPGGDVVLSGPPPDQVPASDGVIQGHWRAAMRHGDWLLAQWSGECEVPNAYFVPMTGGSPVPIAGGVESLAMGWASDGRAVVHLLEGVCGSGQEGGPGVYLVEPASGDLELVHATEPGATAKMWTPLGD